MASKSRTKSKSSSKSNVRATKKKAPRSTPSTVTSEITQTTATPSIASKPSLKHNPHILKKIKTLLEDQNMTTLMLDVEAVASHLDVSVQDVRNAYQELSESSSRVALNFIAQPFVIYLGKFVRYNSPNGKKRWLTVAETSQLFTLMYADTFSDKFVEKRSKPYTIRKLIAGSTAWDSALQARKGILKKTQTIESPNNVIKEFKSFLKELRNGNIDLNLLYEETLENELESTPSTSEGAENEAVLASIFQEACDASDKDLHSFANFVLQEVGFLNHTVRDELSKTLVTLYESANLEKTL